MKYMEEAIEEAKKGVSQEEGGPFGAIIVSTDGKIISRGHNQVLSTNDPTAHAEIVAIRKACQSLNTKDLSNCVIYSTCEPCPMCLSAIIWSNIKTVYYGSNRKDAKIAGFKDEDIYNFLAGKNNLLERIELEDKSCKDLFINYDGERY